MSTRGLHHTYKDYLHLLEVSRVKLEYCDGEIYAMAGGTPEHAALAATVTRLLGNAVLGSCRVFSSDLKVRIEATDLSTFPDITLVCGESQVSGIDANAIINPSLLVEITSPSTEDFDRGEKLSHYKQLPSLFAVLLVSHRRAQVTLVERSAGGWTEREYRGGEVVVIQQPALTLSVDEIYRGISFTEPLPS
ncbi:MAG: Uma2 family endonuclease [Polyangiaceae bacterium]|nr:Uma2 family endonuclease [Polyangiaceae bacterium]